MASEIIKRDANHVTVAAAISNDASEDVIMFRVDPSTGYLLTSLSTGSATAANSGNVAKRDPNHVPVVMGYNEDTGLPEEILTDEDGNLLCDVLIS